MDNIRVACIGDSLTYGYLVEDRPVNCYPSKLQRLLGEKYTIKNFGVNGLTMLKNGPESYWESEEFQLSLHFNPNIVIIMLGTNDSKPALRSKYFSEYFEAFYFS